MDKHHLKQTLARIRNVLLNDWDPIGVRGIEEAQDEYDGYVGRVHQLLLRDHSSAEAIAAYLFDVAHRRMGIPDRAYLKKVSARAADALTALREDLEAG